MAKHKKGKTSGEVEQWLTMLKDEFDDDDDIEPIRRYRFFKLNI